MEQLRILFERYKSFSYKGILAIALIFCLIAALLFTERVGIRYNYERHTLDLIDNDMAIPTMAEAKAKNAACLVLYNSSETDSYNLYLQFETILSDMKQPFFAADLSRDSLPGFDDYSCAVVLMGNLAPIGERITELAAWVYGGGRALFAHTLEKNPYTATLEPKLGIKDSSYSNSVVDTIWVDGSFMIGGDRSYAVDEPFDSAWAVQLNSEATRVYARTADDRELPLIWSADYGKGRFVVDNFGIYTKVMRGFFAASYSILEDICVYPVINGSAFYLDDFPSQIPSGSSEYIQRDYNTSIRDFYVNIWWPDMLNSADKYGIKYTGLAIECYDDAVDGTVGATADEGTFLDFGNMLLRRGGEIGYHGYNHQPLCLSDCDYRGIYDYKTWESTEAMRLAFDELDSFCKKLFPDVRFSVYVPPSNILSDKGRAFLKRNYPQIRTISGIYFEDDELDFSCTQEYGVADDGIIDQPRIISGCSLSPFMELASVSELNFHFINNHFTHPDDALDIERGADMGWEKLSKSFNSYLDWLYSSAPMIRNFTGTELSAAVQRWDMVRVNKSIRGDKLYISLDNLVDEAYLMLRFNEGRPDKLKGGTLTRITGDLYLLEAKKSDITIEIR